MRPEYANALPEFREGIRFVCCQWPSGPGIRCREVTGRAVRARHVAAMLPAVPRALCRDFRCSVLNGAYGDSGLTIRTRCLSFAVCGVALCGGPGESPVVVEHFAVEPVVEDVVDGYIVASEDSPDAGAYDVPA